MVFAPFLFVMSRQAVPGVQPRAGTATTLRFLRRDGRTAVDQVIGDAGGNPDTEERDPRG